MKETYGICFIAALLAMFAFAVPVQAKNISSGAVGYMEDRQQTEGEWLFYSAPEGKRTWVCTTKQGEQLLNSDRAENMTCMATDSENRALVADIADADGVKVGSGGQEEATVQIDGPVRFMALPEGQKVPLKKR